MLSFLKSGKKKLRFPPKVKKYHEKIDILHKIFYAQRYMFVSPVRNRLGMYRYCYFWNKQSVVLCKAKHTYNTGTLLNYARTYNALLSFTNWNIYFKRYVIGVQEVGYISAGMAKRNKNLVFVSRVSAMSEGFSLHFLFFTKTRHLLGNTRPYLLCPFTFTCPYGTTGVGQVASLQRFVRRCGTRQHLDLHLHRRCEVWDVRCKVWDK